MPTWGREPCRRPLAVASLATAGQDRRVVKIETSEIIRFTIVSIIANIKRAKMNYIIEYFNARLRAEIHSWPADLLADFARMVELLMDFGP